MAGKRTPASTGAERSEDTAHNVRIWEALSKTDPSATKGFTRNGGFKGTAIKPVWTALRMTEHFGPCGIGWGMDKPEFCTEWVADELFVFCTVGLWYVDGEQRGVVWGVGGDQVSTKSSSGVRTSDEAFKKAYTDAMGNAMKQLGVAADVHMGLFDDNKYVEDTAQEYQAAKREEPQQPAAPPPPPDVDQADVIRITQAIEGSKTIEALDAIMRTECKRDINVLKAVLPAGYAEIVATAKKRKEQLTQKEAA